MTALSWVMLALAAAGLALPQASPAGRLSAMLDRAIAGGFGEDRFDETELSALEGEAGPVPPGLRRFEKGGGGGAGRR